VYGERMDAGLEFVSEGLVDHPMTSDPALSAERASYDINPEMRFSAGSMSGVAFMLMGLVEHLQAQRSEGFGQLPRNGFLHTHRKPRIDAPTAPKSNVDTPLSTASGAEAKACSIESVKLAQCPKSSA
jgi:hypothetical protein